MEMIQARNRVGVNCKVSPSTPIGRECGRRAHGGKLLRHIGSQALKKLHKCVTFGKNMHIIGQDGETRWRDTMEEGGQTTGLHGSYARWY
jgi:hypothetical protein